MIASPGETEPKVRVAVRLRVMATAGRAVLLGGSTKDCAPKQNIRTFGFLRGYIIDYYSSLTRAIGMRWILAPFIQIAQHVEQPQVVGQQPAARPGVVLGRRRRPGIAAEQVRVRPEVSAGESSCPASIFPLGLGRKAVARPPQGISRHLHPLGKFAFWVRIITFTQIFLAAEPVAVGDGVIPGNPIHWSVRGPG